MDSRALTVALVAALAVSLVTLVLRRRYKLFQVRILQTDRFEARRVATRLYVQRAVFVGLALVLLIAYAALWLTSLSA